MNPKMFIQPAIRISVIAAVIIGILTARPLLGGFDQAFQFIQEFTGFFTPGIVVIFILGLFWRRATRRGVVAVPRPPLAAMASYVPMAVYAGDEHGGVHRCQRPPPATDDTCHGSLVTPRHSRPTHADAV